MKNKFVTIVSIIAACFAVGGFLWAYFTLSGIHAPIFILHFDDLAGITKVGDLNMIIFIGIFGFAIVLINYYIAVALEKRDPFLGKVTAGATLVFSILLFLAFAAILNVN